MLRIDIERQDIDRMVAAAGATDRQIEQARSSALRKMRAPIRAAIRKAVAKARRIPERAMESRIFSSSVPAGAEELKIWIGTRSIDLFAAGTPRQTKAGVTVGRLRYPGAFIARIHSQRQQVWIRLHSRHYDPELYPTRYRPGDHGLAELRGRFPVVRAAIAIDDIVAKALEDGEEGFRQQFLQISAHELDYYVNIRGGALMYGLMDLLVARLTDLTADLRFHHRPTGRTIAPQVIATCMPERDSNWQEGMEWPHVCIAICGGGFDRLEPQPHQVVVGCGIWTPATVVEGTADIMALTAAVGRIVEGRTFKPFRLRTPVRYTVGSEERGYEGTQPHPYAVSSLFLELVKF